MANDQRSLEQASREPGPVRRRDLSCEEEQAFFEVALSLSRRYALSRAAGLSLSALLGVALAAGWAWACLVGRGPAREEDWTGLLVAFGAPMVAGSWLATRLAGVGTRRRVEALLEAACAAQRLGPEARGRIRSVLGDIVRRLRQGEELTSSSLVDGLGEP